jgi:DNA-binding transcriptional LysR family regulator
MVNLEWYRSFVEVYRVGTVSGAAQVLHLTQPAVSQHIAALESALGAALFARMPRQMVPTDEGKRLYTQAAAAIEKLESISSQRHPTNTPQLVRFGTPQECFAERLLKHLPQAENLLYRVRIGLAPTLIDLLLEGQLDAAIATQKIPRSELEYQLIAEEHFWLVASPAIAIPIALETLKTDLAPLEQWIKTQPLVAYSEELPIIRRFWRVVFGRRLDIIPRLVLPDLCMIRQAIAAGFGFSVLPDYLCAQMVADHQLTLVLKPANAVTNQLWLAYRKSERQSYRVEWLLEFLRSTLGQGFQEG